MIETSNILKEALSEALSTMAFLDIMPLEDDLAIPKETALGEMSFSGPKSGTIQILASLDFCRVLAENIGALDEVDDETCLDALKELCNVTCGLLLPKVTGSASDVFDVTVPVIKSRGERALWDEFSSEPGSFLLNIEDYLIATKLVVEDK